MDHGSLVTAGAASAFKPLPAFVDALMAPFGSAAGDLWLACARAGVVISAVLVYHLAKALGGRAAAVTATAGWLSAKQVAGYLTLEGMSEPLCAAFVLLAVDAHLCRHRRLAVVLGAVAALVRIELWPFVACYAAVTFFTEPRRPKTVLVLVVAVLAVVPAAWFLPDAVSSGDLFRSVVRATQESQGGPLLTSHPGLSTVAEGAGMFVWPLVALFVADTTITVVTWVHNDWVSGVNVQQLATELPIAVSKLGGRHAAVTCGTIAAAPLQNPAVAWALDVTLGHVGISPSGHGVVFATDGQPPVHTHGYRSVGTVGPPSARWALLTTCGTTFAGAASGH
jgi:hypothetical protein